MQNPGPERKPRIFQLWDEIFGTDKQEDDAAKQGGIKRHDRQ